MSSLVKNRLIKSISANAFGLVARIANQLLLVPILIMGWSTELFGEWMVISTIPTFIALSDFGFIAAGSNELAKRASQSTEENVIIFYNNYSVSFQRWSFIFAICIIICSFLIPFDKIMGIKLIDLDSARYIFILLSLSALVAQNSLLLLAGLRIRGKFHIALLIRAISMLIQILLIYLLIYFFNANPLEIALLYFLLAIVAYIIEWMILKNFGLVQTKNPFLLNKSEKMESMKPYLLMGLEMMLMPLSQALILQGSVILIGNLLGSAMVAQFITHRTLARMSASLLQVFSNPLRAEAGLLQREDDKPLLRHIVILLSRLTFWLSLIISIFLVFLGDWIFKLWTGEKLVFDFNLFIILLIGVIAESLWRVPTSVRLGSNKHRPIAWGYFIFSIIGLFIAILLSFKYHLIGIAIGICLTDISMMILAIYSLKNIINISVFNFILSIFTPPVLEINEIFIKRYFNKRDNT